MAKKNQTDATLRNVRAAKKAIAKLTERVKKLEAFAKLAKGYRR